MDIDKILFGQLSSTGKIDKSFEDLDVNKDGKINEQDENLATNIEIKNAISQILASDIDEEPELSEDANFEENSTSTKTGSANSKLQDNINLSDPKSCLSIWNYGMTNVDETKMQITKDSKGRITDIIYEGIRYGIRYDENENIVKTIRQTFDEEGRINYQQVDNWKSGNIKNQVEYNYDYDENGNRIQTSREAIECSYLGNPEGILTKLFGFATHEYDNCVHFVSDIKRTKDGKVTDFMHDGIRYSVRYDGNGNVTKAFTQEFDENGKITKQTITNIKEDGTQVKEVHTYDEDGVDNTSEAMQAVNRVRKLYTSKTGDSSKSQDTRSKFYAFIENKTIEKLSAAGVSRNDILNLFDELFPNVMDWLLNDMGDSATVQYLHNKYGILYPEFTRVTSPPFPTL